jgi:glycosyltransferase involved in cell wall biosynthesis
MKILEIVSGIGVNGAIVHCWQVAHELAQRGHDVTLACYPQAVIGEQIVRDKIDVVRTDLHRWPGDELRRMADFCREKQIDVVHAHTTRAHNFGALLRWMYGIPCVASAHNRLIQFHWMWHDQVIAVSEATRRYYRRLGLVRDRKIRTIHNFIDDSIAERTAADARMRVRDRLGLDEHVPLVVMVGNIIARKGVIYLVQALPAILRSVPDVKLLLVGESYGAYHETVRAEAERLQVSDRLIWMGHQDDVASVLAASDLFALSTLEDNFPLTILEAMAIGLPVVATRVGGIPECVVPGQTGELVPRKDVHTLADAVAQLLLDPALRRKYGAAGREVVRKRFSPASQVPQIEAALAAAAKKGPRAASSRHLSRRRGTAESQEVQPHFC